MEEMPIVTTNNQEFPLCYRCGSKMLYIPYHGFACIHNPEHVGVLYPIDRIFKQLYPKERKEKSK
jgi:hypothetical protein